MTTTGRDFVGFLPNDCTNPKDPCRTVQHAVSRVNPGDAIRVATGLYTDLHSRSGGTQVVYVDRSVVVRGGYTSDFKTRNPKLHPTTLNAEGGGRVVYITGDVTARLEGLHIIRGDAAGMGGAPTGDAGGGICVVSAMGTVEGCQVYDNAATNGSGIYIANSTNARMTNNSLHHSASSSGGGIYLRESTNVLLGSNYLHDNTAATGSRWPHSPLRPPTRSVSPHRGV